MLEMLIFTLVLMFINILFCLRPTPILAIPVGLFTFYMTAMVFIGDKTLPAQPYYSFFLLLICAVNILENGISAKEK